MLTDLKKYRLLKIIKFMLPLCLISSLKASFNNENNIINPSIVEEVFDSGIIESAKKFLNEKTTFELSSEHIRKRHEIFKAAGQNVLKSPELNIKNDGQIFINFVMFGINDIINRVVSKLDEFIDQKKIQVVRKKLNFLKS